MSIKELLNKGCKWLPLIGFVATIQSSYITNTERQVRINKELSEVLEKENLIHFYNTPCILDNYTVTEKADGLRTSVFINSNG